MTDHRTSMSTDSQRVVGVGAAPTATAREFNNRDRVRLDLTKHGDGPDSPEHGALGTVVSGGRSVVLVRWDDPTIPAFVATEFLEAVSDV